MELSILTEILDDLPLIEDKNNKLFKPKFGYGTQADLLKYLSLKRKGANKTNIYPLVWLQTGFTLIKNGSYKRGDLSFILATLSNRNISNRVRTNVSFLQLLDPLQLNVEKAINAHSATRLSTDNQSTRKYFNYENDIEKGATDIWDATAFQAEFELNLNCINKKI